jgi:tripartite-type tricarboxylate transporter receptor subunit TctC
LQEAGFEGMVLEAWYAAFCPKDTPGDVTYRLNAEINAALTDASIRDSLRNVATEVTGGSPEGLLAFAEAESTKYEQLISDLGLKID